MRAPSSLYSTDASPVVSSAAEALAAVAASIGSTGRPDDEPDGVELVGGAGQRQPGRLAEVAGEHRGATYGVARAVGGAGDRVGEHAFERPRAHVAEQHARR